MNYISWMRYLRRCTRRCTSTDIDGTAHIYVSPTKWWETYWFSLFCLSVCLCLSVTNLVRASSPKRMVTFHWNLVGSISMKSSFASRQSPTKWWETYWFSLFCTSVCLSVTNLVCASSPKRMVTFHWNLVGSISMESSFASRQCCSGRMIFSGVMALWKIFLSVLLHLHRVLHFDETWQEASVWSLVLHLTNAVPVEWFSVELWPFEKYSCPLFS